MKNDFIKLLQYTPIGIQKSCLNLCYLAVQKWLLRKQQALLHNKNMQDAGVIETLLNDMENEFKS